MSRIAISLGGFKSILTLVVFALITALIIIPGSFNIVDASIDRNGNKNTDGRSAASGSQKNGIENYDIRKVKKDESVSDLRNSFRSQAGLSAAGVADMRDAFVRAEESLRAIVPTVKVEYSSDLRAPEVISPSVWGGEPERLTSPSTSKRSAILRSFVKQHSELFGVQMGQADELVVTADYENPDGNMSFAHLEQQINGIPVFAGEVKAGFTKAGEMVRVITNVAPGLDYARVSRDFGDPVTAVKVAAENIRFEIPERRLVPDDKVSDDRRVAFGRSDTATTAEKIYFPMEPGVARAAWRVLLWTPVNAYYVIVDAETRVVLWRKNITEDQSQPATYNVYRNINAFMDVADSPAPISPGPTTLSGAQGAFLTRADVTLVGNEAPFAFNNNGWITDGGNTTDGNNVQAGLDRKLPNADFPANPADIDPDGMAVGSPNRVFSYTYSPMNPNTGTGDAPLPAGQSPGTCLPQANATLPTAYQQGAVTQLFYITNRYHDAMYQRGFTETARNFQHSNFTRGGAEGDRISAQAQDCSGANNANFSTPADGTRGQMQMYLFTIHTTQADGDLDAEIVIHELSHGTSNRLIGNASGMSANMSRGMGEGWSDFLGHTLLAESADPINGIYTNGAYALYSGPGSTNSYYGVRRFPKAVIAFTGGPQNRPHNPLTFADLNPTCNLGDGAFAPAFSTTPADCDQVHNAGEIWSSALWEVRALMVTRLGFTAGTTRVLQAVTDGMKMTPNNPTFLQARDAIVSAGTALPFAPEAAADVADIREGFRRRGMGFLASIQAADPASVTEAFELRNARHINPFSVTEKTGDGDGFPEPGEPVLLNVPVINSIGESLSAVQVNANGGTNVNIGSMVDGQTSLIQIPYTVPGGATCGSLHQVTINVTSEMGAQIPVTREFRLGAPAGGANVSFTNNTAMTIPDSGAASTYPSVINVSGLSGNKNIRLTLNGFRHEFEDDVDMLLVGPGGQSLMFMSDVGGSTELLTPINFSVIDSAAAILPDSSAITPGGEFRPSNVDTTTDGLPAPAPATNSWTSAAPAGSGTFASVFGSNGATMNGNWSLFVFDDAGGDVGAIEGGWTLTFIPNDFVCAAASQVPVSGRVVNAAGRGLSGVRVSMTDGATTRIAITSTFGYFRFVDVPINVLYTITPKAKRYSFTPQQVTPTTSITTLVFTGT